MAVDNIARGMAASALKNQGGGGVSKASELDNDVPFVSASDSQTLTEAQQKQAQENIGLGGLVVSEGGDTLTWDGNTEGLVEVDLDGDLFYKVSDEIPTMEDFVNGVKLAWGDGAIEFFPAGEIYLDPETNILSGGVFIVVPQEATGVDMGLPFPEAGIYFLAFEADCGPVHLFALTIPGYTGFVYEKIKPEYQTQADWGQNDPKKPGFVKNRPFYCYPAIWGMIELIDDNWGGKATCKLSFPVDLYRIRVDGEEYTFDDVNSKPGGSAIGYAEVFYVGAEWFALNSGMDFSEYPFSLVAADSDPDNIYAVFEDGTMNHTVEFLEVEEYVEPLDPKYLPKVPFVPDVTSAPTMDDFNNLLAALRDAGYMET